jgi:hypothetical protein
MDKREITMRFRLVLSIAAALVAIAVPALESSAAEMRKGYRNRAVHRPPVRFLYGGYYGQIGGYRYGPVPERYEFQNESAYNYPGHYNNQSLWERVQTQRNFPVQY